MNLIEALKTKAPAIRRPIAKHVGSGGAGWLSGTLILHVLLHCPSIYTSVPDIQLIDVDDLLADDWEIKNEG